MELARFLIMIKLVLLALRVHFLLTMKKTLKGHVNNVKKTKLIAQEDPNYTQKKDSGG